LDTAHQLRPSLRLMGEISLGCSFGLECRDRQCPYTGYPCSFSHIQINRIGHHCQYESLQQRLVLLLQVTDAICADSCPLAGSLLPAPQLSLRTSAAGPTGKLQCNILCEVLLATAVYRTAEHWSHTDCSCRAGPSDVSRAWLLAGLVCASFVKHWHIDQRRLLRQA
jgi:hypothetical protein